MSKINAFTANIDALLDRVDQGDSLVGDERKLLRLYYRNTFAGAGNSPLKPEVQDRIDRIRSALGIQVPEYQQRATVTVQWYREEIAPDYTTTRRKIAAHERAIGDDACLELSREGRLKFPLVQQVLEQEPVANASSIGIAGLAAIDHNDRGRMVEFFEQYVGLLRDMGHADAREIAGKNLGYPLESYGNDVAVAWTDAIPEITHPVMSDAFDHETGRNFLTETSGIHIIGFN